MTTPTDTAAAMTLIEALNELGEGKESALAGMYSGIVLAFREPKVATEVIRIVEDVVERAHGIEGLQEARSDFDQVFDAINGMRGEA